MDKFKVVPASYLLLEKAGKLLMIRRFNTGFSDGMYSLVAGHLDGNETFIQAMVREAKEEAGLSIRPGDLSVVHVMHRKMPAEERVDVFLKARKWEGEPRNTEPHKCDHMAWFPLDSLPANTIPYIRQAVEAVAKGVFYSEHGWP